MIDSRSGLRDEGIDANEGKDDVTSRFRFFKAWETQQLNSRRGEEIGGHGDQQEKMMVRGETYFDLETFGTKQKRRSDYSVTDVVDSIQGGRAVPPLPRTNGLSTGSPVYEIILALRMPEERKAGSDRATMGRRVDSLLFSLPSPLPSSSQVPSRPRSLVRYRKQNMIVSFVVEIQT